MFARHLGPPMKPAWAATMSRAASERTVIQTKGTPAHDGSFRSSTNVSTRRWFMVWVLPPAVSPTSRYARISPPAVMAREMAM